MCNWDQVEIFVAFYEGAEASQVLMLSLTSFQKVAQLYCFIWTVTLGLYPVLSVGAALFMEMVLNARYV